MANHATDRSPSSVIPVWALAWQRLLEWRIGVVPVPIFVALTALTWYFVATRSVATDLPMMIAVVAIFGFACAENPPAHPRSRSVRRRDLRDVPAFRPGVLPRPLAGAGDGSDAVHQGIELSLPLHRGSHRRQRLRHRPDHADSRVCQDLRAAGGRHRSCADRRQRGRDGVGLGFKHTLLYVVIPVMAGGVGEGALPLAMGYSGIVHQPLGVGVRPGVATGDVISSLMAILIAGALNTLAEAPVPVRQRTLATRWTGRARFQPGEAVRSCGRDAHRRRRGDCRQSLSHGRRRAAAARGFPRRS